MSNQLILKRTTLNRMLVKSIMVFLFFWVFSSFAFAGEDTVSRVKYVISVNNSKIDEPVTKEKIVNTLQDKISSLDITQNSFLITRVLTFPDFSLVFCEISDNEEKIVEFLEKLTFVRYVEKSTKGYLHEVSNLSSSFNDPYIGQQWYLGQVNDSVGDINYKEALEIIENHNLNTSNKVVAVIDTGVNKEHEDLQGSLWINNGEIPLNGVDDDNNGYVDDYNGINALCVESADPNCMINNNDITDTNGHGTAIASIISAQRDNNKGMMGLSDAKILTCKITVDRYGSFGVNDELLCLNYFYDLIINQNVDIDVLNLSFGQYNYMKSEEDLLKLLSNEGVIIVASSGNEGANIDFTPQYPASYNIANLLSIGSINKYGDISYFSNYGQNKVDIFAPGEDILVASYDNNSGYNTASGTSYSAPIVAGVIPILKAMYPYYTPEEITALLMSSGQKQDKLLSKSKTGRILKLAKSNNETEYYGGLTCSNQIEYGLFDNNLNTQMFTHELNDIQLYGINCADTYKPDFSISGDTDYVMAHLVRDDGVFLASYYPEKTKFLYNIDLSLEKELSDADLKEINLRVGNMEKNIYISKLDINIDSASKNIDVPETQFDNEYYNSIGVDIFQLYRDANMDILSCVNVNGINFPKTIFGHDIEAFKVFANNVIMFYQNYSECIKAQNELQSRGYYYFGEEGFIPYLSNVFMFNDKLYDEVKPFLGDIIVSPGWIDNVTTNVVFVEDLAPYLSYDDVFNIFELGMFDNKNNFQSTMTYISSKKIEFAYANAYAGNNNVVAGIFFKHYPEKDINIDYSSIKDQDILTYTIQSPVVSIDPANNSIISNGIKFEKIDGQLAQNQLIFQLLNSGDRDINIKTHKVKGSIFDYINVSYICEKFACTVNISADENFSAESNELSGEVALLTNDINNPLITIPVTLSEITTQTDPVEPVTPEEPVNPIDPVTPEEDSGSGGGGGGGCSAIPYSNNSYFLGYIIMGVIIAGRLLYLHRAKKTRY